MTSSLIISLVPLQINIIFWVFIMAAVLPMGLTMALLVMNNRELTDKNICHYLLNEISRLNTKQISAKIQDSEVSNTIACELHISASYSKNPNHDDCKQRVCPESNDLYNTETFLRIKEFAFNAKCIPENSYLWIDLETMISENYPAFKNRLLELSAGKITKQELRIAMLTKVCFSPTEIKHLIGRTKGAISYARNNLSKKIYGTPLGTKIIDQLIINL